jgi:hypothetical protein
LTESLVDQDNVWRRKNFCFFIEAEAFFLL